MGFTSFVRGITPRAGLVALGSILVLAAAACDDPCSGVASCVGEPRISYIGEVVRHWSGRGGEGTRIDFIQTGGVPVFPDSFSTTTDERGLFRLEAVAETEGEVVADIIVTPATRVPYRVNGVKFVTTRIRGDGKMMQRWVVDPYFPYVGELFQRGTLKPVQGARVEFRWTGGTRLPEPVYESTTDAAGRFPLLEHIYPPIPGEVIGDLVVHLPNEAPSVIRGVRLETTHVLGENVRIGRWGVGATPDFFGEVFFRASAERAAGVEVEFRRTGGVPVSPDRFVVTTDAAGRFRFPFTPEGSGEVEGELIVRPAAPMQPTTVPIRFTVFPDETGHLLGIWGVGAHLPYTGLVYLEGAPGANVEVEVRRVSGIPVRQESYTTRTSASGNFPIGFVPLAEGELVVEVTIRPPAPYAPLVVEGLKLSTTHEGVQGKLAGVWNLVRP